MYKSGIPIEPNIIEGMVNNEHIDTSWMSITQKKFFEILRIPQNSNISVKNLLLLTGLKSYTSWRNVCKDERFLYILNKLDINVGINEYPPHYDIEFIKGPNERNMYLQNEVWDVRKLFIDYPRHVPPSTFIVDFSKILNFSIRKIIKEYFKVMLSKWHPVTFKWSLNYTQHFINTMNNLFPNITSFSMLTREYHIEKVLSSMCCSNNTKRECLKLIRSMFIYMYINKWECAPTSLSLIIKRDIPKKEEPIPKPIPPNIRVYFDKFLNDTIIPLLEEGKDTPYVSPIFWDMIIIYRHTGIRTEDVTHLIEDSDNSQNGCLKDTGGNTDLFLSNRISKANQELLIPLNHLDGYTKYGNIVKRAIMRQRERVKILPPSTDGYKYLFRELKDTSGSEAIADVIADKSIYCRIRKICNKIPLRNYDNSIYLISPHQFRHTIACEMIESGIDLYAIKEFLGHSCIETTEKYVKLYHESLKEELNHKLAQNPIKDYNIADKLSQSKTHWIKNKILAVLELGDSCCEHAYNDDLCPNLKCKTCSKKKIYPRHIHAVNNTIACYTTLRDDATFMGLIDKRDEFNEIVDFYNVALEIISNGGIFIASRDFYK